LLKFGAKKHIHVILPTIEESSMFKEKQEPSQFVYVGRLVFYKNLEVVIKAVAITKKSEPKIKLIIVGDGPHKNIIEDLTKKLDLESNVEFRGYVNAEEKTKLIASSLALVLPSFCEGFGLVILESFAQNKPVLVSNVRPLSDIISDGKTGFVLVPYDEKIWSEHLLKIIKNPELASTMGNDGKKLLNSKYGPQTMYENIIKMYQNTLQN